MANEERPCPCDIGDKFEYGGLGEEVEIEHFKAYICRPQSPQDRAVIVVQDIFGWDLPNTRFIVDLLAANGYIEANATLRYLKEHYNAKRFAVIGFCWGGTVTHHLMLTHPEIKAGVSLYGIIKDSDDRYALKNPTLFIFGENDSVIPHEQVTLLEQKLEEQCKVDYEVKVYPGQTHGFVHRRKEDINPDDKPYIEEARRRMIEWLNKYI
ncbi:carboxymethylenebutenolidase homolog isoform X2 [Lissotriton helveticus]